jgi:hypothetical protein
MARAAGWFSNPHAKIRAAGPARFFPVLLRHPSFPALLRQPSFPAPEAVTFRLPACPWPWLRPVLRRPPDRICHICQLPGRASSPRRLSSRTQARPPLLPTEPEPPPQHFRWLPATRRPSSMAPAALRRSPVRICRPCPLLIKPAPPSVPPAALRQHPAAFSPKLSPPAPATFATPPALLHCTGLAPQVPRPNLPPLPSPHETSSPFRLSRSASTAPGGLPSESEPPLPRQLSPHHRPSAWTPARTPLASRPAQNPHAPSPDSQGPPPARLQGSAPHSAGLTADSEPPRRTSLGSPAPTPPASRRPLGRSARRLPGPDPCGKILSSGQITQHERLCARPGTGFRSRPAPPQTPPPQCRPPFLPRVVRSCRPAADASRVPASPLLQVTPPPDASRVPASPCLR